MTMIERTPYHGCEIQLWQLSEAEIVRQNRKDDWMRRRAIIRCTIRRWLGMK